jgi:trehalose/maltose hydrolase-like predicted phosphorylase
VIGPDEYHEVVDDNAFTNVMARWHLRRAAELGEPGSADAVRWRELADSLVDGYDPATGRYEQFAGYWELEPLLITEFATPPVTADVLLGADRVAQSQILKQADVLMLHHLVPDEVAPGSLGPNLAFYLPRTAHGSSLSPSVHAALLARAGEPDRALELFRVAARLDLNDSGRTTAGGLHLANLGGIWQALAFGFLGLRARGDALEVDPRLPDAWQALELTFQFRSHPVGIRAEHGQLMVRCTEPLTVRTAAGRVVRCEPPGRTFGGDISRP